jgi:hypothetical protein
VSEPENRALMAGKLYQDLYPNYENRSKIVNIEVFCRKFELTMLYIELIGDWFNYLEMSRVVF